MADKQVEHKLTRNPLGHGSAHVYIPSQFTDHFVETVDCIGYMAYRFQTFTYGPINYDSGKGELQTTSVNLTRGTRAKKDTHAGGDNQGILPLATRQY